MKLKILFVTMQLGEGYTQGTEKYLINLGRALNARGHETTFAAGDPEGRREPRPFGQRAGTGLPLLHLPTTGWMTTRQRDDGDWDRLLEEQRPDIVHLANPAHIGLSAAAAARRHGIPLVISVTDFWWICPKHTLIRPDGSLCEGRLPATTCMACIARERWPKLPRGLPLAPLFLARALQSRGGLRGYRRWLDRNPLVDETLAAADALIFLSRTAQARIARSPDLAAKAHLIPAGIDESWFTLPRRSLPASYTERELTIGFAGAIAPHKGLHLLIEAAAGISLAKVKLRIAGAASSGEYLEQIRRQAGAMETEFCGLLSPEQMRQFLQTIDLLVVPSLSPENQPQVILEALAAGLPVLSSSAPGARELIADEAMIFELGSSDDLRRRLEAWALRPRATTPAQPPISTAQAAGEVEALYRAIIGRR